MTTKTQFYTTTLTVTSCGSCGIGFAIPDNLFRARRDDGASFYCPNGHFIGWKAANEQARLERALKSERDRVATERARADGAEASLRTTKGHVTRLRKQVLAGECPLCGQHLRDLARHISRQHPDEKPEVE
jgi:predicted RNA-binding Zn-ribbon protein involved in translation (DUF1610 family)